MACWWYTGRAGCADYRTEAFLARRLAKLREKRGPLIGEKKPNRIKGRNKGKTKKAHVCRVP